ncbi:carbohydrate ABC transporter permease [Quadrisphaera sp. INWT6]|uniref:carbohydrate ABC transporter permease n=1 Tax=Quadrisphaera sp. INWT6 TaxID=2596917 RepID=UPI0018924503|nr:sugar ABC transporter permease [Quadrisphaera sp. INWT6]MBF5080193.1 sugar ABC transporter permease [Quadrisphaera sp. INWT6]
MTTTAATRTAASRAPAGGASEHRSVKTGSVAWMAIPAVAFFVLFGAVPLIGTLVLSFTQWDGIGAIQWLGGGNWVSIMTDPVMYKALGLTFGIMIFSWLVQTPISLLLGVFTAGTQKYRAFLAVLYFLPLLMSAAAISIAYKALLDPNFGLAASLGIPFLIQNWLGDPTLVLFVVIFVLSWMYVPFHSLLYQGGVQQIPRSMYEAASIDGAGTVRQFFSITLPQLKYTIITSSTLMVVGSMTAFDLIFVLTGGGPGNSTRVLALDMYLRGFRANQMGPASAIAVLIVLIGLGLALFLRRLGGKDANSSQMEGL